MHLLINFTKRLISAAAIACAAALAAGACAAGAGAAGAGGWGVAREVPGLAALNTGTGEGGGARIAAVSCGSPGNCSAVGSYTVGQYAPRPFVVSQKDGIWGRGRPVPGLAALRQGGFAQITSVSCASAGNCTAGGAAGSGRVRAFVISEAGGVWGRARRVGGLAQLTGGSSSGIGSVSCAAAGGCSAVGTYGPGRGRLFAVSQVHGIWGQPGNIPGMAALAAGGVATVLGSVSCASAGNCAAGGHYSDGPGRSGHPDSQAFVVTETSGTWGRAREVPGTAALNKGKDASISSVSCAAPGGCSAGGSYYDGRARYQAFVVWRRSAGAGRGDGHAPAQLTLRRAAPSGHRSP